MWEHFWILTLDSRTRHHAAPDFDRRGSHTMLSLHAPELLLDFGRRWHLRLGGCVCPPLLACGCSGESAQAGESPFELESGRR